MAIDLKSKLSSRKLWASVAGIVTGLAMVFGLDESIVSTSAGAVTALASIIVYIITEGKIDTAKLSLAIEKAQEAVAEASKPEAIGFDVECDKEDGID